MKRGFTLIELLIVIAIIAILALIAVPNFLEAQVRAKVSRVHADIRSITTAIECYIVDYQTRPLGLIALGDENVHDDYQTYQDMDYITRNLNSQSRMTTPIAYITSLLKDPFQRKPNDEPSGVYYLYESFHPKKPDGPGGYMTRAFNKGHKWAIGAKGPSGADTRFWLARAMDAGNDSRRSTVPYDPTNGTMSQGVIVRTDKGYWGATERRDKW